MAKIKIGVIGCGAVAYRWYLKALAKPADDYELFAVCDSIPERAKRAGDDFSVPHICTSLEVLAKLPIDLAVILTRHEDHFEHIRFFLERGINVYSEKPFAPSAVAGAQLVQLAEKTGSVFASAPQVMFSSRNQTVKKLLEAGTIGTLAYIRASSSNLGPAGRTDTDYDPEWFYNEGGSLGSLGIYGLSALLWIVGMPQKVSSFQGIAIPKRTVVYGPAKGKEFLVTKPDSVVALLDFGSDVFAVFDGSYVMTSPPSYEMEFHGTNGSLLVGGFGGPDSVILRNLQGIQTSVGPNDDCHLTWTLGLGVIDTVRAMQEGRTPAASAVFAHEVLEVMDAMKYSAEHGSHVIL